MNCPNCASPNEPNEPFCLACGTDLTSLPNATTDPSAEATTTTVATATPVATGPVLLALKYDGKEFPLYDGGSIVIARNDTDKCKPDIGIGSDRVSSAPVEVKAENGKATIYVDPRGVPIRVTKLVRPGESIDLLPGEMMMLGDQIFVAG